MDLKKYMTSIQTSCEKCVFRTSENTCLAGRLDKYTALGKAELDATNGAYLIKGFCNFCYSEDRVKSSTNLNELATQLRSSVTLRPSHIYCLRQSDYGDLDKLDFEDEYISEVVAVVEKWTKEQTDELIDRFPLHPSLITIVNVIDNTPFNQFINHAIPKVKKPYALHIGNFAAINADLKSIDKAINDNLEEIIVASWHSTNLFATGLFKLVGGEGDKHYLDKMIEIINEQNKQHMFKDNR